MASAGDIMTTKPLYVSANDHATHVRSLFRDTGFRSIPVISNNRLEGIITRGEILNISSTKSNIDSRGIMEPVKILATPNTDVIDLTRSMLEADVLSALVVESSESMRLVGIITVSDLLKVMLKIDKKLDDKTVENLYTKNVITCESEDLISHVWNHMDSTGFSGIPVMKNRKLIGMITRKDIIDSGNTRINRESGDVGHSIKIEKIMKTPPLIVTPHTPAKKAAEILLKYDVGRLPVVENPIYIKKEPNRVSKADLIGIISREDILWSFIS